MILVFEEHFPRPLLPKNRTPASMSSQDGDLQDLPAGQRRQNSSNSTPLRSHIAVLANVAGITDAFAGADTFTDTEFNRVMAINLTVPLHLMRAVLPLMKAQKSGAIVNVASKSALSGAAAGVAYTASKHGLVSFTYCCFLSSMFCLAPFFML